jgi:hypothetical protein
MKPPSLCANSSGWPDSAVLLLPAIEVLPQIRSVADVYEQTLADNRLGVVGVDLLAAV